jgi:hypothetical protein
MTTTAQPPMSASSFRAWLARAEPCAGLEYHRGFLSRDRSPVSDLAEGRRRLAAAIADAALAAAEKDLVHLVQRRNGPFDYSYLAIKASVASRPVVAQVANLPAPVGDADLEHPAILPLAA